MPSSAMLVRRFLTPPGTRGETRHCPDGSSIHCTRRILPWLGTSGRLRPGASASARRLHSCLALAGLPVQSRLDQLLLRLNVSFRFPLFPLRLLLAWLSMMAFNSSASAAVWRSAFAFNSAAPAAALSLCRCLFSSAASAACLTFRCGFHFKRTRLVRPVFGQFPQPALPPKNMNKRRLQSLVQARTKRRASSAIRWLLPSRASARQSFSSGMRYFSRLLPPPFLRLPRQPCGFFSASFGCQFGGCRSASRAASRSNFGLGLLLQPNSSAKVLFLRLASRAVFSAFYSGPFCGLRWLARSDRSAISAPEPLFFSTNACLQQLAASVPLLIPHRQIRRHLAGVDGHRRIQPPERPPSRTTIRWVLRGDRLNARSKVFRQLASR